VAEERVQYLATHDELTGLPNRAVFGELLDTPSSPAQRHDRRCAVLFIDLDRFKIVNDSLGMRRRPAAQGNVRRSALQCASPTCSRGSARRVVVLPRGLGDGDDVADVAKKVLSSVLVRRVMGTNAGSRRA